MADRPIGLAECEAPSQDRLDRAREGSIDDFCEHALRLSREGEFAQSEAYWRRALELSPNDPELLNELGLAVWRQGRAADAEPIYRRARDINPYDFRFLSNLGLSLYDQHRIDEASDCYRRAIAIEPAAFDALMNLGLVLSDLGKFDQATNLFDAAFRIRPDSADLQQMIGINLGRQGRWDEAIQHYERGLRLQPDFPRLRLNLAYALLGLGDYERGWPEHEWRLKWRDHRGYQINRPLWNGGDIRGRTILLHAEQGLGDTLQFIRFASLVKARGAFVWVCCPSRLLRTVARCEGVDLAFDGSSFIPDCHFHAPMLSLPAILGTTLSTLPCRVPYLSTDPALVEHWRIELAKVLGIQSDGRDDHACRSGDGRGDRPFLIGIAWQGHPAHRLDRWRSFPLAQFAALADLPGVRLISLQNDHGLEQLAPLAARLPVIELGGRRDRDIAETAAIMTHLDLVITPDSAVAHLAGGLGVPVWVGLNAMGDWRWIVGRDDSPWYPTMRLFRQTTLGEWNDVFQRMAESLAQSLGQPA